MIRDILNRGIKLIYEARPGYVSICHSAEKDDPKEFYATSTLWGHKEFGEKLFWRHAPEINHQNNADLALYHFSSSEQPEDRFYHDSIGGSVLSLDTSDGRILIGFSSKSKVCNSLALALIGETIYNVSSDHQLLESWERVKKKELLSEHAHIVRNGIGIVAGQFRKSYDEKLDSVVDWLTLENCIKSE
jgi:hypothetical protein